MVLAAATLGFGVINLDVSVVNVAVKQIGAALGGGVSGVQWVIDAYTLVFAALILSAGALGDRSGHKRLLMAGTRPQAAEARVNTANPAISRRLCPDRSPSAPADKISAANTSV